MPRALIPLKFGNGRRPSDPQFVRATAPGLPGPNADTAVPVLDVADDTHDPVGAMHDAALDPDDDAQLLTGAVVLVDNQSPLDGSRPGPITIHVGASTLHEAATEAVTCVAQLALDMPEWVAATDDTLAAVLAEHYTVAGYSTCERRDLSEVSA